VVRMLDDVYEISAFPLQRQRDVALRSRRIGLGITGLADALIMLGMTYGDPASLRIAADIMQEICHSAYRASIELAKERPVFPAFEAEPYLRSEFVSALPKDIRAAIAKHGIRNSHLTAIAPTGSISLLANNVSSGLEPVFAAEYGRLVRDREQEPQLEQAVDYAVHLYRATTGETGHLPPAFVTSGEVEPEFQLTMQAALQKHVDNGYCQVNGETAEAPGSNGKCQPFARSEQPRQAGAARKKAVTQHQNGGYGNARSLT
jgi:ribonucleoside-diphosphate reductase alpha chain